ncbi:MAG TPA: response regulator [Anaeromyxobacteraceae bacterium]|nr:response regulator [Anaeromyxobacteraceae bacterium]
MARVLIVDDTEIVRCALEVAVRKLGHDALSTSDGLVALELAERHPPDLALLDWRMPGMDGGQLFARLRQMLGERCPKVLFVSGSPPEEVRAGVESEELRPVGYVRKPFHLDDLSRVVQAALAA